MVLGGSIEYLQRFRGSGAGLHDTSSLPFKEYAAIVEAGEAAARGGGGDTSKRT